jgi:hypothetical protein
VIARQHGAADDAVDALLRRRPQRQAVAPQIGDQQVIRFVERVLIARALDGEQRRNAGRSLRER